MWNPKQRVVERGQRWLVLLEGTNGAFTKQVTVTVDLIQFPSGAEKQAAIEEALDQRDMPVGEYKAWAWPLDNNYETALVKKEVVMR